MVNLSVFFWKQKYFFFVVLAFFVAGTSVFFSEDTSEKLLFPIGVRFDEKTYHLEIADTDTKRAKGLGERNELCDDCGMLFVFDTPRQAAFWMKDMRFSIDIIWLFQDEIVYVEHSISPEFQGILEPSVFADSVLEVNAGKGKNLRVGEKILFLYK